MCALKRPIIGLDAGDCSITGVSGHKLNHIGITLRKAANVADEDYPSGKEFIASIEEGAISKVKGDTLLGLGKAFALNTVQKIIESRWNGIRNEQYYYDDPEPVGLRILNQCNDPYRKNRLDWVQLYLSRDIKTYGYILDGIKETRVELDLKKGLNTIELNHVFENMVGRFYMKLCLDAILYANPGCGCETDGLCGMNEYAEVYQIRMGDQLNDVDAPILDYEDSQLYASIASLDLANPIDESAPYPLFGYKITCLSDYEPIFDIFQKEMSYPILLEMGVKIYEASKFGTKFNPFIEAANKMADYYLEKWLGGIDPVSLQRKSGEYFQQVDLLVKTMTNHIDQNRHGSFKRASQYYSESARP